ncbi:MAG: exosortase A [Rhodoferax sp.]|uniref:exosortase A n=1 Tax=Rhodoferax sp. TaxID=50421 RepID=UPI002627489A|nr:exosortase A [Rhodoferax sp.]MDD2882813.1 exosortase A [Rhodoferax sp.]
MNPNAVPLSAGSSATTASAWRQALPALLVLLVWILFLYRDTGIAMVTIWYRSETFAHAFLVPPISLWLIWRQRHLISAQTPQPMVSALVFAAGAAFAWLLGDLVAINAVTQLTLITLLVLAVPVVLGWAVTRLIFFPLGFLFFAVPIGEFVMPQLMEWTADFTVMALRLSGIPVYREGLQFVIPSGQWSVVEACSGVRYLLASLTVGTLFAYLNYQSNRRRMVFVLVSILVPVLANWMRAYLIVMLGHLSGNKLAAGVDHLIYGWVFFGVVIMLMFIIGARWAEPDKVRFPQVFDGAAPAPMFSAAKLWTVAGVFAVLAALPSVANWAIDRAEGAVTVQLNAPVALAANWQAVTPAVADFKPAFDNPSAEINTSYASQGQAVGLYLGYYQHQDYNRKLVSSSNVLVSSKDPKWAQVSFGTRPVNIIGQPMVVRTSALRQSSLTTSDSQSRLLVWQIYWINGRLTSNDYLAKFYSAFYRLTGQGDESAVIVVYTPQEDQTSSAQTVLETFMTQNYAAINTLLLAAR